MGSRQILPQLLSLSFELFNVTLKAPPDLRDLGSSIPSRLLGADLSVQYRNIRLELGDLALIQKLGLLNFEFESRVLLAELGDQIFELLDLLGVGFLHGLDVALVEGLHLADLGGRILLRSRYQTGVFLREVEEVGDLRIQMSECFLAELRGLQFLSERTDRLIGGHLS